MMKKFVFLLFLVFSIASFGQKVEDYQYIIVPLKFSDFEPNQYHLNNLLRLLLKKKDFIVVSDRKKTWSESLKENPCNALIADLKKAKSLFKNKVSLTFEDCNQSNLIEIEGVSGIKDYKKGYQEALKIALSKIGKSTLIEENESAIIAKTKIAEESGYNATRPLKNIKKEKPLKNNSKNYQEFVKDGTTLIKTDLNKGEFLLIFPNLNQIFAHFYPSSRKGIYHVRIITPQGADYQTLGFYDGKTLSYEQTKDFKNWKLMVFEKK